jgi:SAM-dependent methyltransferase
VIAENIRLSRVEAAVYDENHFEIFHPWEQRRLLGALRRYSAADRVLDVAAGTGNVITKVWAPNRVGLDLSPPMLERLRAKDQSIAAVAGLAEALPFGASAFDLVVIYSALHHLSDLTALAEMARVVRPGGAVIIDHEESFREAGWRDSVYDGLRTVLRGMAGLWYWRRPLGRTLSAYRHVDWPFSATFGSIDFVLTDGGSPDPIVVEAEFRRLGLTVSRRHYLLVPLPMESVWQVAGDALCRRLRIGHFAIEAIR